MGNGFCPTTEVFPTMCSSSYEEIAILELPNPLAAYEGNLASAAG